jgi:hypothetical protein
MGRLRALLSRWASLARVQRWTLTAALLAVVGLLTLGWLTRLATAPARLISDEVDLGPYGLPGIELQIIYPARLTISQDASRPGLITVLARATSEEAITAFELVLPLPDNAVSFVDTFGNHVPVRLRVVPGHPDAVPYTLRVAHGQTQLQGRLLLPYRVPVVPAVRGDNEALSVRAMAFEIKLESRWEHTYRLLGAAFSTVALPSLLIGVMALLGWGIFQRHQRCQRARMEHMLAAAYMRLREHIKLEQWTDARREIEQISITRPHYRDVEHLDTVVSAAETSAWRREQLYTLGIQAYQRHDWPTAVQAFRAIEQESPYYRDVRFLQRTAALYADLRSRDRSLRRRAAEELGQVADLLDLSPLVAALGDRSEQVAEAAMASFRIMGLPAVDVLLGGLAHGDATVRERCHRLLEELGQSAREPVTEALRSPDARITAGAATLLAHLGARRELATALLWAPPEHLDGLVTALLSEGAAAATSLIEVLLQAPPERQQTVINALAALKAREDISRRLEEAQRATRDAAQKALLQRALDAQPAGFATGARRPSEAPPSDAGGAQVPDRAVPAPRSAAPAPGRPLGLAAPAGPAPSPQGKQGLAAGVLRRLRSLDKGKS